MNPLPCYIHQTLQTTSYIGAECWATSNIPPSLISACWSVSITCFPGLSRHFLCVTLYFLFLFSSPIQIKTFALPSVSSLCKHFPFLRLSMTRKTFAPDCNQLDLCNRSTSEKQCRFRKCLLFYSMKGMSSHYLCVTSFLSFWLVSNVFYPFGGL